MNTTDVSHTLRHGLIFVIVLLLALAVIVVPATAADTGKAIQLGTNGIKDPTEKAGSTDDESGTYYEPNSYIYFGKDYSAIKWSVLDADKTSTGAEGMFLFSNGLVPYHYNTMSYDSIQFDSTSPVSWIGSDAQAWCKDFAGIEGSSVDDAFSSIELGAILSTSKTETLTEDETKLFDVTGVVWQGSNLQDDKVFFLSVKEVAEYVGNYNYAPGLAVANRYDKVWWLRSISNEDGVVRVGNVGNGGDVASADATESHYARPAFNLNISKVLFISAIIFDKYETSKIVAAAKRDDVDNILTAIGTAGINWKMTLIDESRNSFTASPTSINGNTGDTITITYSGAETGDNEYVSAIIADGDDILYYGRIAQNSESGEATISIPAALLPGSYTLKVFSEQYNGDKLTDYASNFADISLEVTHDHSYGNEWKNNETHHWKECACGDKIEEAEHAGGTETCTKKAVCTTCSKEYGEAAGHSYGEWIANNDGTHTRTCSNDATHVETENCLGGMATCTQKAVCVTCNAEYGSFAEHSYSTAWLNNETHHWHKCTACDAKSGEAVHNPGAAATKTTPQTCTICSYEIAPALGDTPDTSDNNNRGSSIWLTETPTPTESLTPTPTPTETEPAPITPETENQPPYFLIGGLAVLIVLAAGIIVVVKRKR